MNYLHKQFLKEISDQALVSIGLATISAIGGIEYLTRSKKRAGWIKNGCTSIDDPNERFKCDMYMYKMKEKLRKKKR
jgi:hypothetical protein